MYCRNRSNGYQVVLLPREVFPDDAPPSIGFLVLPGIADSGLDSRRWAVDFHNELENLCLQSIEVSLKMRDNSSLR